MRVLVALTVNSRHKVLEGPAVERESGRALALLVLLNGLQHHLLLKEGKLPSLKCKSLRLHVSRQVMHGGTRGYKHVSTCVHVLGQSRHILLMVI